MANKREFKKYINTVCNNIISDMTFAAYSIEGANVQGIDEAVIEMLRAGSAAVMKSNIKYDKTRRAFANEREYRAARDRFFHEMYKKINREFSASIEAALKKFNAALPSSKAKA